MNFRTLFGRPAPQPEIPVTPDPPLVARYVVPLVFRGYQGTLTLSVYEDETRRTDWTTVQDTVMSATPETWTFLHAGRVCPALAFASAWQQGGTPDPLIGAMILASPRDPFGWTTWTTVQTLGLASPAAPGIAYAQLQLQVNAAGHHRALLLGPASLINYPAAAEAADAHLNHTLLLTLGTSRRNDHLANKEVN